MKINNETKIGVMVFVVLVILAVMTIRVGNFSFKKEGYPLRVRFNDIDGVNLNSPVMFNGFEVGIVNDIKIINENNKTKMELDLWMDKKARLREGSKAYIKNLGFMGEKYVGLISSDAQAPFLPDNALIEGQEPPKFNDLIIKGQAIAAELKDVVSNINERLQTNSEAVDQILMNTNDTMQSMSSIADHVDGLLAKNKKHITSLINNLEAVSVNMEEMSYDLKLHPWKILYKTKAKEGEDATKDQ